MTSRKSPQEPVDVWTGPVGEAYLRQHAGGLSPERRAFWARWEDHLARRGYSVLEVGAGTGDNLGALDYTYPRIGVDVSAAALRVLRARGNGIPVRADARALPFADRSFDLVVTAGCLIHVPRSHLPDALDEIGRVAIRDVLLLEYDDGPASTEREIPWRGHTDVCWARPYAGLFCSWHQDFALLERRPLPATDGWDRVTLAHLRRRGAAVGGYA